MIDSMVDYLAANGAVVREHFARQYQWPGRVTWIEKVADLRAQATAHAGGVNA
jgi:hypothetical protein